jgi:precorrin-3B C17-methyltransferase
MSGTLHVVGLGPGPAGWLTPAAAAALDAATDLVGYGPYLARVPAAATAHRHVSDNREEIARARHALALAAEGRRVAVVSGGDPGVFAMAAAVFEAIETGESSWRCLDVVVEPGVTAVLAAAARLGAPLGHDFAVISLSDNLKPFDTVLARVRAAAEADFVLAFYNPVSKARPWQLDAVLDALRATRAADTSVAFARAVGRPDERMAVVPLNEATGAMADMSTLVLVGSSTTRRIARADGGAWLYTPRRADGGGAP